MKSTLKKAWQSVLAVLVLAVLFASASVTVRAQTLPACSPNCQNANLSNANLAGLNLSGINFQGAILTGANLQNANLQGDNLQGADLANAILTGAILNGNGTNLQNSILNQANLSGAHLQDVSLQYATLYAANLTGAYLQGADLQQANLSYAILTGWNTQGANLQGVNFANAVGAPPPPPPLSGPVLAVVGDIACQPGSEVTGESANEVCDDANPSDGYTSTSLLQSQSATATQIENMNPAPAAVALLGDLQYQVARYSDFEQSFDTTYGAFKSLHQPAPGNHEIYSEHGEDGVAGYGYFSYYNGYETDGNGNMITVTITDPCKTPGIAGDPNTSCKKAASTAVPVAQPVPLATGQAGQFQESGGLESTIPAGGAVGVGNGYYSYNLGSWHLISLNIECYPQPGGCSNTGSWFAAELAWLKSDLAANNSACTLAYWHQPTFSATNGITEEGLTAQAFWNLLYQYKADLVLNGHDHLYAHYIPLNPSGNYDPIQGIREFTVGTGGETLDPIVNAGAASETTENPGGNQFFNESNLEAYSGDYWGVMALTLGSNSYSWAYTSALQGPAGLVPLNGPTFPAATNGGYTDSGFGACHGGHQASNLNEITFTTPAPASAEYGSTFTVAASGLGTGAITYTSDGVACTNSGASYTMISGTGACTATATQAADSNYLSASASQSVTAEPAQSSVSVQSSGSPSVYGSSVTFTATIGSDTGQVKARTKRNGGKSNVLSGTVSWSSNTNCSPSPISSYPGTATCTTSALNAGSDTVTATYSGDSNHSSNSGSVTQTVNQANPTVSFTGLPSSTPYNTAYTLVATTNASTTAVLTDNSPTVCSLTGTTVTIVGTSGNCSVTATWAADTNYASATKTQTSTTTKGKAVITWQTPSAIVYGTPLSSTQLDASASPSSVYITPAYSPAAGKILDAGNQTLKVTYAEHGDSSYSTTTDTVTLVVNQASTTTTITSPSRIVTLNRDGTVSVRLASSVTSYRPTGSVTLTATTGEACSGTVTFSSGDSSCSLIFTTTGTRTITATYSGDANHTGSNNSTESPAVTVTVNQ